MKDLNWAKGRGDAVRQSFFTQSTVTINSLATMIEINVNTDWTYELCIAGKNVNSIELLL